MKMAIWWGSALAAAVLTVSVLLIYWSVRQRETAQVLPSESPYRIIGVWQGRVAVFLPDVSEPELVYDTPIAVLPTEEQEQLTDGIPVETAALLQERLEDYVG